MEMHLLSKEQEVQELVKQIVSLVIISIILQQLENLLLHKIILVTWL